jgi:hypothetical protein
MDAQTIAQLMSMIPERTARAHSGCTFAAHEGQGAELRYLAPFLSWLSPLATLSKDDQRALGLLAAAPRPAAEEEEDDSAAGEDGVEPLEVVDDAPLGGARPLDALLPVVEAP